MLFFAPNSIKVRVMEKQHDFLTKLNGVGDPLLKFAIGNFTPLQERLSKFPNPATRRQAKSCK
jgi:hypothetical protein